MYFLLHGKFLLLLFNFLLQYYSIFKKFPCEPPTIVSEVRKCHFQYCLNLHLLLWVKLNILWCLGAIFLSLSMKCLLRSFACFSIQYLLILLLSFKELSLDQEYTSVFDRRCRYVPLRCRCLWAFACRGFYFIQRISGISLVTMTYQQAVVQIQCPPNRMSARDELSLVQPSRWWMAQYIFFNK